MSVEKVRTYLAQWDKSDDIQEPEVSTATVEEAALAVGVEPARIAKSISVYSKHKEHPKLIVTAGDAKLDNLKFKAEFDFRPRMMEYDDVEKLTGHQPGGVCPFANPDGLEVYLDVSLQRFESVLPACGSARSLIDLTISELEEIAKPIRWVDVCKNW